MSSEIVMLLFSFSDKVVTIKNPLHFIVTVFRYSPERRIDVNYFPCSFAQLSFSEAVRLNTSLSGVESGSTLK